MGSSKSLGSLKEYPYERECTVTPTALEMAVLVLLERCPRVDVDFVCVVTRCTDQQALRVLNRLVSQKFLMAFPPRYVRCDEPYFRTLEESCAQAARARAVFAVGDRVNTHRYVGESFRNHPATVIEVRERDYLIFYDEVGLFGGPRTVGRYPQALEPRADGLRNEEAWAHIRRR